MIINFIDKNRETVSSGGEVLHTIRINIVHGTDTIRTKLWLHNMHNNIILYIHNYRLLLTKIVALMSTSGTTSQETVIISE